MPMKKRALAVLVAGAALAAGYLGPRVPTTAWADDIQAIVDARRAMMKEMAREMKAIADALDAKSTDMASMQKHAELVQADAAKIPTLFPTGSSADDLPGKTHAKPEIWQNFDGFKAKAATLGAEAGKLADAAKSADTAAVAAQFDQTGRNGCGACHKQFRLPLQ
jgi:cytochrome c556